MIFSMEFKNNFGKLIAWTIVIVILLGLMTAFFPLLVEPQMTNITESLIFSMGDVTRNILGIEDGFDLTNISEYIALIYYYIGILVFMFAMQIGASSLSKEQASGNISYIYSNPISKSEIVTGKLIADTIIYIFLLIFLSLATFGFIYAIKAVGINAEYISNFSNFDVLEAILRIFISLLGGGLVFMAIGFFISACSWQSLHQDAIATLFIFLIILLTVIAKAVGGGFLKAVSFFPNEVFKPYSFISSNLNLVGLGLNLVIFIVFIILTYLVYGSKELKY